MTADEITATPESARTEAGWLKEIAWQLARLNEREPKPAVTVKRK